MFVLKLKCKKSLKNNINEKIGGAIKTYLSKNPRSYITSGMGQLLLSVKENKDIGDRLIHHYT